MSLIRPRLTEFHGVYKPQAELDFAIPFFDEDIPLYVDPFLLWKSPSQQDKALHFLLLNSFNHLGFLCKKGRDENAIQQLIIASECDEVGLGQSATRRGKRIGRAQAEKILNLFKQIPHYAESGFRHIEEIQFYVDGISKDRISDIACQFIKSFLIDFTIDQCTSQSIPLTDCVVNNLYNQDTYEFDATATVKLPINPRTNVPMLLVPKRWLRFGTWLDFDDYFKSYCPMDKIFNPNEPLTHVKVLNFNRDNYGVVDAYIKEKERSFADCKNDPLFQQIPIVSAKRRLAEIQKLPTGKEGNADKKYEDAVEQLLASLLYPHLDFAQGQARTDSGVLIRDLIFYNNKSHEFFKGIFDEYGSKQVVFEMKNVASIQRNHILQLNRYLADELGKFGIFVTRNALKRAETTNVIDLWSGQRKAIITLTDLDIAQMVELFESKQRLPIDVIKKKYIEFRRQCPS